MKRREFSAALLAAGSLAVPGLVSAQQQPREGVDYRRLSRRAPTQAASGQIEVVEFFWYSCRHCNAFEPQLEAWSKTLPADVVLRRVPVAFRPDFVPQQRLFYTLQALNKVDELHAKVFHAIHMERQPTNRPDGILEWAEKQGLDKARFAEVFNSDAVGAKVQDAMLLQDAYGVEGVPALGIGGRFYTDGSMAGSLPRSLMLADYLIAEARKARG
ncbi:thiol:disulfide interchange protein DsbA/DsbL [Ramlibacter rhizophilus]|uniref:Thiol:disulfide interchange protein n=1 Tax=Ramlibacter rhizophilus TaxID=1781167 RepID=A0A4Z0BJN2_9BURK|nr:thiol:disulfide interchange protein DsbA/DsbL [Ramlibacter rhizophilus]TFY98108.1 thiol:disulfide interchange protein DsbA/DsbL [Ramlibacter rhizophilus]